MAHNRVQWQAVVVGKVCYCYYY